MRRFILLLALALASGVAVAGHSNAGAAAPAPVLLRDSVTGKFDLTPPAPDALHTAVIQPDTQIEPSIAVNPSNNQNVVAAYQEGRVAGGGDMTNGWSSSFDGGRTWTYGHFPCLTYTVKDPVQCPNGGPYDRASDAVVAFGPDNTVYANHLVFNDESDPLGINLTSAIAINVSRNGGRTWGPPVILQDDKAGGLNDKNWIVVDNSDAPGHHKGRIYVVWDRVVSVDYNFCDTNCDQPVTPTSPPGWQKNFLVAYPGQAISSIPVVMPSGNLGVFFHTDASAPLHTPTDQPVSNPIASPQPGSGIDLVIAPIAGALPVPAFLLVPRGVTDDLGTAIRQQRASDGTLIDAEVDPATGRLYVAWADGRSRSDGVNDAYIVSSADGGLTWGPQTRINPGSTSNFLDHYNVTVAVGPDSAVRVAYRQRQEAANVPDFSPYVDTYYQESRDLGATWSTPLQVNSVRTNVFYGAFSRNGLFEGDYNQIVAAGPFSYIVREEALPNSPNEPHGLMPVGNTLTGNTAGCPQSLLAPSCLTHSHQRNWVAVVGPGQVAAATTSPLVSPPAASPIAGILPTTAVGTGLPGLGVALGALALLLTTGLALALARRRRA